MAVFYPTLKLRYEFSVVKSDNGSVAACAAFTGVIKLENETAEYMFSLLNGGGASLPELIKKCMDKYGEPVEKVGPVVIEFLDGFREKGLLVADKTSGMKFETPEDKGKN